MEFNYGNIRSLSHKKLKLGDYTIRPFEANKLWQITTDHNDYEYYKKVGINVYRALYPENHKYFGNVANISSSLYDRVFTTQSLDPKVLWYYLDHNFYTEYRNDKVPNNITDDNTITYLAESSSLMIIPVGVFGEGILQKSFSITNHSNVSSSQYKLIDDGFGNLRDTDFNENNFVNVSPILYLGFNEKYREYNMKNKKMDYVLDMSYYKNDVSIKNVKNIDYYPGIPTTDTTQSTGVCAEIHGTYFQVKDKDLFNFSRSENFAFSFWLKVPSAQTDVTTSYNPLFNKNRIKRVDTLNEYTLTYTSGDVVRNAEQYPFDIFLNNSTSAKPNTITFKQSSNEQTAEVTSSALTPNSWNHIICQKSASYFQIWINGTLNNQTQLNISKNTTNDHNFYIAGNGPSGSMLSGSLDEVRVYRKALSSNEITYLYDNSFDTGYAYQTSRVGNIFNKSGFAVISDPRPKYKNAILGETGNFDYNGNTNGFVAEFRSTTTFYQYEIICKLRKHEFNFTQNPSIRKDGDTNSNELEEYVYNRYFNPFITSIGLYNDKNELLAIAKLANPLEKRDDVDINVIIRFDI
jgi:hypothetical protein